MGKVFSELSQIIVKKGYVKALVTYEARFLREYLIQLAFFWKYVYIKYI